MIPFLTSIANIGSDPNDSEEVRLQKTLLIAFSGTMAFLSIVWAVIYFSFDEVIAGAIPMTYSVVSMISLGIFSYSRSLNFLRISQLFFSLILPFALMVALGGYEASSAVIVWSLTAPLGALVFKGKKEALWWFLAYLALLLFAIIVEGHYSYSNNLSSQAKTLFFGMNIAGMSVTAFIVLRYFVGEKNIALTILESKHRWIKEAFSAYISPNLVEHLINHPEELELGGERRECTFVFTDLVGFTPLVEKTDPSTLVSYLNEYFEGMTEIVFKHQGTVSKIVGDAIAVMFSAPVIQKDHAERAVACALEMDDYAQKFAQEKEKQGLALGYTRIGVNTGTVIIGNVGSKNQLDYRALGDAINTAARLESANKQLGTRVCISGTTVAQCANFIGRPIGALILKGKTKPVETFEPLSKNQMNSSNVQDYLKAFELMDEKEPGALQAFEALLLAHPNDKLARFHYDRMQNHEYGSAIVLPLK